MNAKEALDNEEMRVAVTSVVRSVAQRVATAFPSLEEDDLAQQGYLAVLSALPKYDRERGTLRTWLWVVAHNAMMNLIRRERREVHPSYAPLRELERLDLPEDIEPTVEFLWEVLSPVARTLLTLRALALPDRLTATAAGKILGMSRRDVRRAQDELRSTLMLMEETE